MSDIVTDLSIPKNWNVARGFNNTFTFTFTQSGGGGAFVTTTYTFSLQIRRFGATTNTIELTQSSGITNGGASGIVTVVLTAAQSALLLDGDYFWQLSVVHPDTFTYRWYNGTLRARNEIYNGDTATGVTTAISVNGTAVTGTISLAGSTLQISYDNGDGTISLINGKPLIIYNSDQSQTPLQLDHLGNLTVVGNDNTSLIELRVGAITDTYLLMSKTALAIVSSGNVSIKGKTMTTVGGNIFSIANPSALKLIRTKADNTVEVIDPNEFIGVACSDETTVLAAASTSVPVATFHAPYALTLTRVFAGLRTAGTGAAVVTVDIHVNGTTVMSATKILFTASQKLSADGVLTTTSIAAGDYVEIFLDQRDTDNVATGLKAYLVGYKT